MFSFAQFGNDLYTGRRSYNFVGRRKIWYALGGSMILISLIALFAPGLGLNAGIEFRGGSEFKIMNVSDTGELRAQGVVTNVVPGTEARVSKIGTNTLR